MHGRNLKMTQIRGALSVLREAGRSVTHFSSELTRYPYIVHWQMFRHRNMGISSLPLPPLRNSQALCTCSSAYFTNRNLILLTDEFVPLKTSARSSSSSLSSLIKLCKPCKSSMADPSGMSSKSLSTSVRV